MELQLMSATVESITQPVKKTSVAATNDQSNNRSDESSSQSIDQSINQSINPLSKSTKTTPFFSIAHAMIGNKLESFRLSQIRDMAKKEPNHLQELVTCISNIQSKIVLQNYLIKVSELFISIQSPFEKKYNLYYKQNLFPPVDLTCLIGPRMHTLDLDLSHFNYTQLGIDYILMFFGMLLSTLTYFKIDVDAWELYEDDQLEIQALLTDSFWLPRIRFLDIGKPFFICHGLSTVMHETGTQRPFQSLKLIWKDQSLNLHPFSHLEELTLKEPGYDGLDVTFFEDMGSDSMPKLKSFDFTVAGSDGVFDVNRLLIFLSQRPIEKLRFIMQGGSAEMFVALSDEAVQASSNMHSLMSLELDIHPCWFDDDDVARLIARDSWPALKSLKLIDMCQSVPAFEAILLTAPALEEIEIHSYSNNFYFPVMHIFQMHSCPSLRYITTEQSGDNTQEFDNNFLSLFSTIPSLEMEHLNKIQLRCPKIDLKVLHMLLSKLSLAPIEVFRFPPRDWFPDDGPKDLTAFQLIMQRSLTHLTQVWPGHSGANSLCVQGMQRTLPDGTIFPFEDVGQSILRFSTARDENSRTGREAFFDHVYQQLTADEKATLTAWDEGSYGLESVLTKDT